MKMDTALAAVMRIAVIMKVQRMTDWTGHRTGHRTGQDSKSALL